MSAMPWTMIRVIAQISVRALREVLGALVKLPVASSYNEVPKLVVSPKASVKVKSILQGVPSLAHFSACPWAPGSCSQMLVSKFVCDAGKKFRPWWREIFTLSDGVNIALDWKFTAGMHSNAPIVMLSHGLGGDSSSHYIKAFSEICVERGWRAVCYNRRGHAGMSILPETQDASRAKTSRRAKLFPRHADVDDMHEVAMWVRSKFPEAPMFIVGYSAGSNVVVKYLATYKDEQPFIGAVSVSNAHDLDKASYYMKKHRPLSNALIAEFLREKVTDQEDNIRKACERANVAVDMDVLKGTMCFRELEEGLLPMYGYKDLKEYYSEMSCVECMRDVSVPLLCLGNLDDLVVCPDELVTHPEKVALENANVISVVTQRGGHIGWVQGWRPRSWLHGICAEFIASCLATSE